MERGAIDGDFSNFGSLKSTETQATESGEAAVQNFSNFGSLKSTETPARLRLPRILIAHFSNFGSLKSTETPAEVQAALAVIIFQQFRLVEEH